MLCYIGSRLVIFAFKDLSFDFDCSSTFLSKWKIKLIFLICLLYVFYFIRSERVVIVRLEVIAICSVLSELRFSILFVLPGARCGLALDNTNVITIAFIAQILLVV